MNWVSGTTNACHRLSATQRAAFSQYSIELAAMQRSVRGPTIRNCSSFSASPERNRITAGRDGGAETAAILSIRGRGVLVLGLGDESETYPKPPALEPAPPTVMPRKRRNLSQRRLWPIWELTSLPDYRPEDSSEDDGFVEEFGLPDEPTPPATAPV